MTTPPISLREGVPSVALLGLVFVPGVLAFGPVFNGPQGWIAAGGGVLVGLAIGLVAAWRAWQTRSVRPLLPIALAAAAALPFFAFLNGHPFRIRYMVPLIAASGALIGVAVGAVPRRARPAAALVVAPPTIENGDWKLLK